MHSISLKKGKKKKKKKKKEIKKFTIKKWMDIEFRFYLKGPRRGGTEHRYDLFTREFFKEIIYALSEMKSPNRPHDN